MIIKLFGIHLKLQRPFLFLKKNDEFILHLNKLPDTGDIILPIGYVIKKFELSDLQGILSLLKLCKFDFSEEYLNETLKLCLPQGVHLISHLKTNTIVSMMMSRHLSTSNFMFAGRIDWLASHPAHSGLGLGEIAAKLATLHLIKLGYKNIWVTTHLHRKNALKIFLKIGFVPHNMLNDLEKLNQFKRIFNQF